jgi:hypothetical protein
VNLDDYGINIEELKQHNIEPQKTLEQLQILTNGKEYVKLDRPATLGDGIIKIPIEKHEHYLTLQKIARKKGKYVKFVPASGAASRMFKSINKVFSSNDIITHQLLVDKAKTDKDFTSTLEFIDGLENFAFFDKLIYILDEAGFNYGDLKEKNDIKTLLEFVLTERGLNLLNKPKGLIDFHKYFNGSRTPFLEHIEESLHYIKDSDGHLMIHFTIAEAFEDEIREHINEYIKKTYKEVNFEISYSYQKKSTDTIAVTHDILPFRNKDGSLVFRPGGHGALIENLNELKADKAYIKNIDNVVSDRLKDDTITYNKLLGGYLEEIQKQCFSYIRNLENELNDLGYVLEAAGFCLNVFSIKMPIGFNRMPLQEKADFILSKLDRPIRVCGMVKNEGEPGGGPFWVRHKDEAVSLQIVEKSQIDIKDEEQNRILSESTHFNPVDIVCSLRNYKDEQFDLMTFIDKETYIITDKSKDGKELKALELPGLWNGAMSDWNTVFIEVPQTTFSPVKTVNDLLRKDHQI